MTQPPLLLLQCLTARLTSRGRSLWALWQLQQKHMNMLTLGHPHLHPPCRHLYLAMPLLMLLLLQQQQQQREKQRVKGPQQQQLVLGRLG
jgi:hypothetical protein